MKRRLGPDYISVSARFMELLGDFVEPKQARIPLGEAEATELMDRCIEAIRRVRKPGCRVLLTSDSNRFLRYAASKLDFAESIAGDVCHISVETANRDGADFKTFADFFAIAGAAESYLLLGPGMYPSNFSRCAARSAARPLTIIQV